MKRGIAVLLLVCLLFTVGGCGKKTVGVIMPLTSTTRWASDGENLQKELQKRGYKVAFAMESTAAEQAEQIEKMLKKKVAALVIAAQDSSALGKVLQTAKNSGAVVVAYDRLLTDTTAVDAYVTFDSREIGRVQAQTIENALQLKVGGSGTVEIFAGSPTDRNAQYLYDNAMQVLAPYIESGSLTVPSEQTAFEAVATPNWDDATAKERCEQLLQSVYREKPLPHAFLCQSDSIARGVVQALQEYGVTDFPIITGQDCSVENLKHIVQGRQTMTVYKDTALLATKAADVTAALLNGDLPADAQTLDNGAKEVATYFCDYSLITKANYHDILAQTTYFSEHEFE